MGYRKANVPAEGEQRVPGVEGGGTQLTVWGGLPQAPPRSV